MPQIWDVIVIGAGHAGCEAALAAAKMGQQCLLITMTVDNIAAMSCNPAIGGLAKGHMVKEIDALGGAMGLIADKAAIQYRILNRKKGPAVRATRAQTDMLVYKEAMRSMVEEQPNLSILQAEVKALLWKNNQITGIKTLMGDEVAGRSIILTTGTFMEGLIHIGDQCHSAGRAWEFASLGLSEHLRQQGFQTGRLKTGTTPRLDGRSIDFDVLEPQPGDEEAIKFSFWGGGSPLKQVPCHITFTNETTHRIIQKNIKLSALYSGAITGVGPRYCPSIEDKVTKFKDKNQHHIFLEPTSLSSVEYYPNGMSTSLPLKVQIEFLRSIKGLEQVQVIRPGYAIEYDYLPPTQLKQTLETKQCENLYFAGQINGTSGYEEAAAQGLMAGINAALKNQGLEPLILKRNQAYIGVLIDDLVTKGTLEPYRMFTSRAEFRLALREDNADVRLCPLGRQIGLLKDEAFSRFERKLEHLAGLKNYLKKARIEDANLFNAQAEALGLAKVNHRIKILDYLKKPDAALVSLSQVKGLPDLEALNQWSQEELFALGTEVKYEGYVLRMQNQIKGYLKLDAIKIPQDFNFKSVGGLSNEVVQKLLASQPQTLGQAAKISGVTPAAVTALMIALKKPRSNQGKA